MSNDTITDGTAADSTAADSRARGHRATGEAIVVRGLRLDVRGDLTGGSRTVVHDISFTVRSGASFGIVGESGSGKTLTTRALAGLLPSAATVSGGSIRVLGEEYANATADRWRELHQRSVGVVFQNPMTSLNPRMTVFAQLREALPSGRPRGRADDARRVLELLESVRVPAAPARLRQYPHELSGGIAQRVAIAMSLARNPSILIADEPTTALDATTQTQVLDLLDELRTSNALTVVLVSHDLDVVRDRCDDVAVMRGGEIVESGTTAAVATAPAAPYTRELLASTPRALASRRDRDTAGHRDLAGKDTPVLELTEVSKSFDRPRRRGDRAQAWAVDAVSLAVRPGEIVGLVGESGSGKTTTARIAVGLVEPDRGGVRYDGAPVHGGSRETRARWRDKVQFVFQDSYSALNPRYTVGQCVLEPLLGGRPPSTDEERERARHVLVEVGLDPDYTDRRPHQLSGGERQRVGIARALVRQPRLIIADEPVSALDVTVQRRILDLIVELNRRSGTAFLVISHDLGVIGYLCDRVAVMQHGRIIEHGAVDEVLRNPRADFTRQLTRGLRRSPDGPGSGAIPPAVVDVTS
ncbi:ABC transporter ATP-binding protein [Actinacidiphila sp. ITFR-21]|uniref:ABC transporter ATP-binding protein n=1 Tax=Actinacidiphila sp. ITFR-21 TaxID=3075199 RepID=UPI00288A6ABA|nr:ABC transporter ATP-binding protein [Streptomyces sp. ITFR-21]WNI14234.1 ABC transporter ATP-binding protein [Streptomyces sp. ITFR-21]